MVFSAVFLKSRLVFVLSLPSDGSWAFQVTSYLLSEWKYLNSCCFSSFKLFPPMFLLLGSKAAICTGSYGWQNMRIVFGVGFIRWPTIPGSWVYAGFAWIIMQGRFPHNALIYRLYTELWPKLKRCD